VFALVLQNFFGEKHPGIKTKQRDQLLTQHASSSVSIVMIFVLHHVIGQCPTKLGPILGNYV
jgi:hypothetical protein